MREIVGTIHEAYSEALDRMSDNPTNIKLRNQVRKLGTGQEKNVKAANEVFQGRQIPKNFGKDFNKCC